MTFSFKLNIIIFKPKKTQNIKKEIILNQSNTHLNLIDFILKKEKYLQDIYP